VFPGPLSTPVCHALSVDSPTWCPFTVCVRPISDSSGVMLLNRVNDCRRARFFPNCTVVAVAGCRVSCSSSSRWVDSGLEFLGREVAIVTSLVARYTPASIRKCSSQDDQAGIMFRLASKFRPESEAFENVRAAGFRGAELWLGADVLADWRNVLATAHAYPLFYAVHFPNEPDLDAGAVEQAAWLYRELDCSALVIHQDPFDLHGSLLSLLVPGIRIAVENHALNRSAFAAWAQHNPGLALDVEHLWQLTLDNAPLADLLAFLRCFLREFGDKLRHVHLPGYQPGGQEHRPLYHNPELAREVFSALAEFGYTGMVVSEADVSHQRPDDLRRDVALYRDWFDHHSVPCPTEWLHVPPAGGMLQPLHGREPVQPASALAREMAQSSVLLRPEANSNLRGLPG